MKVLVIGAGATYAEALNLGIESELLPPLMGDFAQQVWKEFNPHPYLDRFLNERGIEIKDEDGRQIFYEQEKLNKVNIEQFFAFCWHNRDKSWGWSENEKVKAPGFVCDMKSNDPHAIPYSKKLGIPKDFFKGSRILAPVGNAVSFSSVELNFWENMLRNGVGRPFSDVMRNCFHINGEGWKKLLLTRRVISHLELGDIVVNLNYDTVFEIAMNQAKVPFAYSPNSDNKGCHIIVSKPHGSLNMVVNPSIGFAFGHPEWLGCPEPNNGYLSYLGLIPPRLNKSYEQNPIAKAILDSIKDTKPDELIFWGVGFTESDIDLVNLFQGWLRDDILVRVVNPNRDVSHKFNNILSHKVIHHQGIEEWLMR